MLINNFGLICSVWHNTGNANSSSIFVCWLMHAILAVIRMSGLLGLHITLSRCWPSCSILNVMWQQSCKAFLGTCFCSAQLDPFCAFWGQSMLQSTHLIFDQVPIARCMCLGVSGLYVLISHLTIHIFFLGRKCEADM